MNERNPKFAPNFARVDRFVRRVETFEEDDEGTATRDTGQSAREGRRPFEMHPPPTS